jgi:hypothetical protein
MATSECTSSIGRLKPGYTYNFSLANSKEQIRGKFMDEIPHASKRFPSALRFYNCRYISDDDGKRSMVLAQNRKEGDQREIAVKNIIIMNSKSITSITTFVPLLEELLEEVLPRLPADCLQIIDQFIP